MPDRPEVVLLSVAPAERVRDRTLERRPLREAKVVADPQVVDLDRRFPRSAQRVDQWIHHRIGHRVLAHAGSERLKMRIEKRIRRTENAETMSNPRKSGGPGRK